MKLVLFLETIKYERKKNKTFAEHRDIFRDTLIAKNVWRRRGSNPRHTGWEIKKIQAPARVRAQDLPPD